MNGLAANLTVQLRDVSKVATAIANGDLTQKITVDVKGELLQIKDVINKMVNQLNSFAAEVTRVAKEVGTEGKLGGQAEVRGVSGTWKDLTDNVNVLAANLTTQVRNIANVTTAVANGDLSRKNHGRRSRRDLGTEEYDQRHGRPIALVRGRSNSCCEGSGNGGQTRRSSRGAWRIRDLERPYRQRERFGGESDHAGAKHSEGDDSGGAR
ncbi:MAG: methyl-accepting chemotaxis protein [Polyangiaceae bacterium]